MNRLFVPVLSIVALSLWLVAPASAAFEGDCVTDAECSQGFTCEVTGGSACACPSEGECPPCETTEYRECVPGPCASDADCADGMTCFSVQEPCPGVPASTCAPGQECPDPPAPEPCEPTTRSACIPEWLLPCEADADCGAGFTCVAEEICSCSGSGGTDIPTPVPVEPGADPDGDSGGGADSGSGSGSGSAGSSGSDSEAGSDAAPRIPGEDEPAPPDCSCEPGDTKVCEANAIECSDASDCPADWSCEDDDNLTTTPDCPPVPEGGEDNCVAPPPPEPGPSMCRPPGYAFFGSGSGSGGGFETPTSAEDGGLNTDDKGSPEPSPQAAGGEGAGTVSGSTGCAGGGTPALPLVASLLLLAVAVLRRRIA